MSNTFKLVKILKGPLGFGFSVGTGGLEMGPVVKQILDHRHCDQLREGDIIVEVNGERVMHYTPQDVISVLERCPKGDAATFLVDRQQESTYVDPPFTDHSEENDEEFITVNIHLMRQVLGFGFRIIGSDEGTQATVGAIVTGGAADLDGRLQIDDEITHVNGQSVVNASHREVVSLMGEAVAQGEVDLIVRRNIPISYSPPSLPGYTEQSVTPIRLEDVEVVPNPPKGPRSVTVHRPDVQTSFGFVLQSNTLRFGCMICHLIPGSPAEKCNQLYKYDELLSVNGTDVSRMDHDDIVGLIKNSGTSINLIVQQPEDSDVRRHQRIIDEEQSGLDLYDSDTTSDNEEIYFIDIRRSDESFGFTITGGAEYKSPLRVLRIIPGGAAEIDRRLRAGNELLEINGTSTENMLHSDAVTIIKHGGDLLNLIVRRVPGGPFPIQKISDSKSYHQLYNEAIKGGYVSVRTSNVLLFGMAGTGKTSTKNLIFGLPPPEKRNSTPLANAAERLLVRKIRNLSGTKVQATQDNWRPITADELKQHIADLILSYSKTLSSDAPEMSTEIATKVKQIPAKDCKPNALSVEPDPEVNPPSNPDEPLAAADIDIPPAVPIADILSTASHPSQTNEKDVQNEEFVIYVANVVSEIQSLVSASSLSRAREVFGSDWVYFIDSGGQPHFYNLLPLFIRDVSAALYVLRLSDRLKDHPLVEYYKDDVPVGDAFRSHLSTADNFKYLVQSIQSHNKDCRLVCVGTHLDKSTKCREKIEKKNQCLFELLPESIVEKCHFNNVCGTEQMILSIDTQVLGDERKKTADTIREIIRECPRKEIKVPIWWYNLEIIIENISTEENHKVLSFDRCSDVARTLNFHKDALVEALKFFHHHHIFHYYPDVLPNVLFCDTQVLLDKVTELVEHAAYLRDAKKTSSGGGKKLKIRDRGIISLDFLANFPKHYVEGLFGPAELIKVFRYLLIATSFDSVSGQDEYFMPSLLGISDEDELKSVRKELEKKSTPLFIQFKNGWPRCGVFCCLQVYLIKEHQWSLGKILSKNKPKQNVVKMFLPNNPQPVTLIDSITYIEIYVESNKASVCSEVRRTILRGIKCSCKALHYDNEEPELAFLCPDSTHKHRSGLFSKTEHDRHPAVLLAGSGYMRCTQNEDNTYPLEEKHKLWIANLDQGNASLPHPQEVDYSQTDCSHAYNTMVTCSVSLNHALSQEPLALAAALFRTGLISQEIFDETRELNETKNVKGNRLYCTVLDVVKNYPTKYAEFVQVLRSNKILYGDVLGELDRTFEHHSLI